MTTPSIINRTPITGTFLGDDNQIYDLKTLLTDGTVLVDVVSGTIFDATFITKTDETANLPNSEPLANKATGFLCSTVVTGEVKTVILVATANQIVITNGDGSDTPNFSISETLVLPGTLKFTAGSTVNNISNSAATVLSTDLMTAQAIQTAIGNAITTGKLFRGEWDASGNTFPTTGGTGEGGAIEAGNWWYISVAGTLGGEPVDPGDQIFAVIDDPGQTASNWAIINPRVHSVFDRVGAVVAEDGDYNESQISPSFVAVTTSTQALAVNKKYYTTYAGLSTMTLPATAAVGSWIEIYSGPSGNTFRVAQNSGQLIYYGAQSSVSIATTSGAGGYLQSTDPNTTLRIVCVVANTTWIVTSNVNSLTVN